MVITDYRYPLATRRSLIVKTQSTGKNQVWTGTFHSWRTRVEISKGAMLSLVISGESRSDCAAKIKKPRSPFAAEIRSSKESNTTQRHASARYHSRGDNWPTLENQPIRGTDAVAKVSVNVRKERKFKRHGTRSRYLRVSFGSFHLLPRGKRPCNFGQWKPPARYRSSRVADWLNARFGVEISS